MSKIFNYEYRHVPFFASEDEPFSTTASESLSNLSEDKKEEEESDKRSCRMSPKTARREGRVPVCQEQSYFISSYMFHS